MAALNKTSYITQDNVTVYTWSPYSESDTRAAWTLVIASGLSLFAIMLVFIGIAFSSFRTQHRFIRSQVGLFICSLLVSNVVQSVGSILTTKWVAEHGVSVGSLCTIQGALKHIGNVATCLWSLTIAVHTFNLMFLRRRMTAPVFWTVWFSVWTFIALIVLIGPFAIEKRDKRGPFWGISSEWCWITEGYKVEWFTNDYLFRMGAVVVSFMLYMLIFLRLRGNIPGDGWRLKWSRVVSSWDLAWEDDSPLVAAGRQLLWYPLAYTIIVLPITVSRWSLATNHPVPTSASLVADAIFALDGLINAILYTTTRRVLTLSNLLPNRLHTTVGQSMSQPTYAPNAAKAAESGPDHRRRRKWDSLVLSIPHSTQSKPSPSGPDGSVRWSSRTLHFPQGFGGHHVHSVPLSSRASTSRPSYETRRPSLSHEPHGVADVDGPKSATELWSRTSYDVSRQPYPLHPPPPPPRVPSPVYTEGSMPRTLDVEHSPVRRCKDFNKLWGSTSQPQPRNGSSGSVVDLESAMLDNRSPASWDGMTDDDDLEQMDFAPPSPSPPRTDKRLAR